MAYRQMCNGSLRGLSLLSSRSMPTIAARNLSKEPSISVYNEGEKESNVDVLKLDKVKASALHELKNSTIQVDQPNLLSTFSGVPEEQVTTRRVRIHQPTKNAMQSGTNNTHKWELDYENQERWENPLMGWTSTADPHSNHSLSFGSKEDAIAYCERQGLTYQVEEPVVRRNRHKLYADNFHWNKRTRIGSK